MNLFLFQSPWHLLEAQKHTIFVTNFYKDNNTWRQTTLHNFYKTLITPPL